MGAHSMIVCCTTQRMMVVVSAAARRKLLQTVNKKICSSVTRERARERYERHTRLTRADLTPRWDACTLFKVCAKVWSPSHVVVPRNGHAPALATVLNVCSCIVGRALPIILCQRCIGCTCSAGDGWNSLLGLLFEQGDDCSLRRLHGLQEYQAKVD